jgi:hypothetical protein
MNYRQKLKGYGIGMYNNLKSWTKEEIQEPDLPKFSQEEISRMFPGGLPQIMDRVFDGTSELEVSIKNLKEKIDKLYADLYSGGDATLSEIIGAKFSLALREFWLAQEKEDFVKLMYGKRK